MDEFIFEARPLRSRIGIGDPHLVQRAFKPFEMRLVVDEPTDLPEGTELELLPLDPGDWLDEADRAALHEALRQSDADVAAGRLVDATEILKALRSR